MKVIRTLALSLILTLALVGPLTAQSDFESFTDGIDTFAAIVAPALPSAAVMGNTWSNSHIGQLLAVPPHFGAGVSGGAVFLPLEGFDALLDTLGSGLPPELDFAKDLGVPFPVFFVEGRIGGFVLPFDLGIKIGTLPEADPADGLALNYLAFGADVRYALLQENLILPGISLGLGYNYLSGSLAYGFDDVTLATVPTSESTDVDVTLADPTIKFSWETSVIDAKLQISKNLLIITPYAGLGASFATSSAGAGFYSSLKVDGVDPSQATLDALNEATGADFSDAGLVKIVTLEGAVTYRVYGGVSLNILIAKLDLQALYNFGDLEMPETGSFGFNIGARIQL